MAEDVTEQLVKHIPARTGRSTQDSIAAVAAVHEWLEFRLGNRDASAARAPDAEGRQGHPRSS